MARMCLSCVTEPADPAVQQAVAEFGTVEVWEGLLRGSGSVSERAQRLDMDELRRSARSSGLRFVIPGDPEWPERLGDLGRAEVVRRLSGVPLGLWLRGGGDLAALCERSVAVVGSRASTPYGERVAAEWSADLGDAGYAVVSGGAYGIDAAAHRGGLAGRMPTVAVLAGGVDVPYPRAHDALFRKIAERGVLVSELRPGEHPTKVRFLGRN
ncbi:MAG: DNA-protecting protein DprA, partial [Bifidobacteriaceae bacterium]|nr:DNA-protecting protein DprA [Bifidobacteriaceae bacterium]